MVIGNLGGHVFTIAMFMKMEVIALRSVISNTNVISCPVFSYLDYSIDDL